MKPKGLLIAVVLLAVLGGLVFWSNKKQAAASKSPVDASLKMVAIPDDQFQQIRVKKLTGEVLDIRRDGGKWALTLPKPLAADQDAAAGMVSTLSSLNADKLVEDQATDLKAYGLGDPTLDVTVTKKDGKTAEVLVGDDTPNGSGAYAKLAGDARVFTIASYVKTSLDKRPDDLRDKRLLTFDSEKLTRVELQAKGAPVEFGKNASNEWQILKPRPLRADSTAVDSLISKLKDAKMDVTNPDPDAARKFAGAAKVATATVADAAGTQTLELRKDTSGSYYAKGSAVEGFYKLGSDVGDALDKGLDDFRNKKLFDFGFSDPSKLEVKGVTYVKTGDKWISGGKTMDNISVQNLIDKLRDTTAVKFTEKTAGPGKSVFEATVTSNDGKRVEKVTIRGEGDQYWAQRENEPSIYELNTQIVADLQKAAGDVKEAAAAAAKKK